MDLILYSRVIPGSYSSGGYGRGVERVSAGEARRNRVEGVGAGRDAGERRLAGERKAGERKGPGELTEAEQRQVRKLQQRDAEVRAHEAAHLAASGGYATSGARYTYQTGPDNRQYAVGGEVSLDISKEDTPEATARKARQVQAAAMAPAQPSAQDMRIAARAAMMAAEASGEMSEEAADPEAAEEAEGSGGMARTVSGFGNKEDEEEAEEEKPSNRMGWMVSNRYLTSVFQESNFSFLAFA